MAFALLSIAGIFIVLLRNGMLPNSIPTPKSAFHNYGCPRQDRLSSRRRLTLGMAFAVLCAGVVLAFPICSLAKPNDGEKENIDSIVNVEGHHFLQTHPRTVGMSIGVVYRGNTYRYNFGTIARGVRLSATADTRYPIASITKTFTASLLARAVIDKKLEMGDDVRKYLDGDYANLSYKGHAIRLFDLLDHRSGLPFFLPDMPAAQPYYNDNAIPFLTRLATLRRGYDNDDFYRDLRKVTLAAIPGSEPPHYSNAGAELLGLILANVYATSFDKLLQGMILVPLDMHSTCMASECTHDAMPPAAYDQGGHQLPDDTTPLGPAGALKSSVNDLLKYMRWQHDDTNRVAQMSRVPRVVLGDYSVGLNWQMWATNGNHLIWQTGNVPGYGSLCMDEKEPGIQLVILMNGIDDATTDGKEALANDIASQLDPRSVRLP